MKKLLLLFIAVVLSVGSMAQGFRRGGFFPPDMNSLASGIKENDTIKVNLFHVGIDGAFAFKCYVPLSMHFEYHRVLLGVSFALNPDRGLSGNEVVSSAVPKTASVKNSDYYKKIGTIDFGYRLERRLLIGFGLGYAWRTDYTNYIDSSTGSSASTEEKQCHTTQYAGKKFDARFFVHYNMGSFDRWNCYVKAGYDFEAGFLCGVGLQY